MTLSEQARSNFAINIKALHEVYPKLAVRMASHTPSKSFRWIDSDDGNPSLELNVIEGIKPILFHSRRDPRREASRQIQTLSPDAPTVYFFAGLGLGYSLEWLWENHPKTINALFLAERDVDVFYYFLHRRDWTLLIANPRVRIVVTDKPEVVIADAQSFLPHIMGSGIRFIDHRPSFQCHPIFYTATIEKFRQLLQHAAAESEFLIQQGAVIQRNAILNLPAMCGSHGLGPLRGFCRNQPAVLIAAGPSLNKNLHHLVSMQSKVLVFCVDTVYRLIRERGIHPDFVASTDPTDLNAMHFEGVESEEREVLVFESDVNPLIPRRWNGLRIFLNSEKAAVNRWIEEIAGPFGNFDQGLSVGHTLFTAAAWMQCNPIILIGFDLAYPVEGGSTHAAGAINNRRVEKASMGNDRVAVAPASFHPKESREKIEWVLGVRGDRVPTSKTMSIFLQVLSDRIKQSNATVFDATEGGALIEGTIPSQFSQVLNNLDGRGAVSDIAPFLEANRDPQEIQRIDAFDAVLSGLQKSKKLAAEALQQTEAYVLSNKDAPPNSLKNSPEWNEIDRMFWELYRDPNVQIALGQALFSSIFLFIRQEKDETDIDRLQKYSNVFESIVRLSDEFIPYLTDSRERIVQSCLADSNYAEIPQDL